MRIHQRGCPRVAQNEKAVLVPARLFPVAGTAPARLLDDPELLKKLFSHTIRDGRLLPWMLETLPKPRRRLRRVNLDGMRIALHPEKTGIEIWVDYVGIHCPDIGIEKFVKKYTQRVTNVRAYFNMRRAEIFPEIDDEHFELFCRRYSLFKMLQVRDVAYGGQNRLARCLIFEAPGLEEVSKALAKFLRERKARYDAHRERMRQAVRRRLRRRSPDSIRLRI